MNIEEIKQAVDNGQPVKYASDIYDVIKDRIGQYLIVCRVNENTIGLHGQVGTPFHDQLNGQEGLFYIDNIKPTNPYRRITMTRAQLEQLSTKELLAEAEERRINNRETLSREQLIAAIAYYDKF